MNWTYLNKLFYLLIRYSSKSSWLVLRKKSHLSKIAFKNINSNLFHILGFKLWAQPCKPYSRIIVYRLQITDLKIIKIKIWISVKSCGYTISSAKALNKSLFTVVQIVVKALHKMFILVCIENQVWLEFLSIDYGQS